MSIPTDDVKLRIRMEYWWEALENREKMALLMLADIGVDQYNTGWLNMRDEWKDKIILGVAGCAMIAAIIHDQGPMIKAELGIE